MSGIYIPGDKVPTKCVGCPFIDQECGGNCVLMPSFDADTYKKQFDRCPFKELRKRFGSVPEHGRLIDTDAVLLEGGPYEYDEWCKWALEQYQDAPTIIPASGKEEAE